jgi:hypothetical protein
VEVEVVKPLDTTALEQAINDAQQKLEPVQESADGKDIEKTDQWATPAERTALSNAIAAAQAVLAAAPEKTQDEIDAAAKALNDATAAFRPQPGLKEDEPQHVHQYAANGFCPEDNAYNPEAQSYLVTTPEQLKSIADGVNAGDTFAGKTVTLGSDLDLSGYESWTPMGAAAEKQYLTIGSQEELDQAIASAPGGLLYDDHGNAYKKGTDKNMTYVDS